jgi:hypothetical protein
LCWFGGRWQLKQGAVPAGTDGSETSDQREITGPRQPNNKGGKSQPCWPWQEEKRLSLLHRNWIWQGQLFASPYVDSPLLLTAKRGGAKPTVCDLLCGVMAGDVVSPAVAFPTAHTDVKLFTSGPPMEKVASVVDDEHFDGSLTFPCLNSCPRIGGGNGGLAVADGQHRNQAARRFNWLI